MRKPKLIVPLLVMAGGLLLSLFGFQWIPLGRTRTTIPTLNVVFPMRQLLQDARLLDPSNTDYISQYHLLENLAVGLIRDDVSTPSGYAPGLAESWTGTGTAHWTFILRPDLKWSDGTPIAGDYIAEHLKFLARAQSRHLVQLKLLTAARFDEKKKTLHLEFSKPLGEPLLHELSLADAVITHPTNRSTGWAVTSGPYSVASYDVKARVLMLEKNSFCPLVGPTTPDLVRLYWVDLESIADEFKSGRTDLYFTSSYSFIHEFRKISSDRMVKGVPNMVYYFSFPLSGSRLADDRERRRQFASLVAETFREGSVDGDLRYDNQMIPLGFSGRLPTHSSPTGKGFDKLRGQELLLDIPNAFVDLPSFKTKFEEAAVRNGVHIRLNFDGLSAYKNGEIPFAVMAGFKGNQKDPLGAWSFLYSEKVGPLARFRSSVEPLMYDVTNALDEDARAIALQRIHARTLEEAYSIPLLVEAPTVWISKRIDLPKWSLFDTRLRLYEVAWR